MGTPKVLLEHVERRFGDVIALSALDLAIETGEFLTLLGPSGCGKTTTLRMIAGFIDPTAGRIMMDGRDITDLPPNRRQVGMVFQNYALFPHLTVAENIAFGMKQHGASEQERRARVGELLDLIKLPDTAKRYPAELSGGQRQRVAIARAVARPPQILLMDEPLGALDLKLREAMQRELRAIQKKLGITTLYVTHDQTEAMMMSDRIVVMNNGRVEQIGIGEDIYLRPATRFVAQFVGRINFLPAQPAGAGAHGPLKVAGNPIVPPKAAGSALNQRAVTLAIRPEHVRILPDGGATNGYNALRGRLTERIFVGSSIQLTVEVGAGVSLTLDARPDDSIPPVGASILIGWEPDRAVLLDPDAS
jgi:putative spermidine/putrescine transport system ATP-binding protein